jgi:hypothetical protein
MEETNRNTRAAAYNRAHVQEKRKLTVRKLQRPAEAPLRLR